MGNDNSFQTESQRKADFKHLWNNIARHGELHLQDENDLINYLEEKGFFTAPASTKYHGAYEGGLYDHSRDVFIRLQEFTDKLSLQWTRPESPFIVGMFHDLCKCDQYISSDEQLVTPDGTFIAMSDSGLYKFNEKTVLKGHGDKSVMILASLLKLTEEEVLCIRYHMGAYEKDDWDGFDRAIRMYSTVLFTHTADMMASKVDNT